MGGKRSEPAGITRVVGDWDDVDAAVRSAVTDVEMVVLRRVELAADQRRYELLGVRSTPAWVRLSRLGPAAGGGARIEIRAEVDRFGEPARARRLREAIARRLRELRGVEVAPRGG